MICTWFLKNQVVKIKFDKWIFSLQKSISKLIFEGYIGSKNQVWKRLKTQFVKLDFSNLIFPTWFFQLNFSKIKYRSTGGQLILLLPDFYCVKNPNCPGKVSSFSPLLETSESKLFWVFDIKDTRNIEHLPT